MSFERRKGSALYYDALPEIKAGMSQYLNFDFWDDRLENISFEIDTRGNNFLALCSRTGFDDDKDILTRALSKNRDYAFDGVTLTLFKEFLLTLPIEKYSVFSAVFDRGQSIVFSIWHGAKSSENPQSLNIIDFEKYGDKNIEREFKTEFFSSARLESDKELSGEKVLRLSYDFSLKPRTVTAYFESYAREIIQLRRPVCISMQVYGDGSKNGLSVRLYNRSRATVVSENELILNWHGWKKVCFYLPEEAALPFANWEVARLDRKDGGAEKGFIKIARVFAHSKTECQKDDFYIAASPPEWKSAPVVFDFHGIVKGATTTFNVCGANGYVPEKPVRLECLWAADRNGTPLDFVMPALYFDESGQLETKIFTNPDFTGDAVFALRVCDSNGRRSDIKTLVSAPKDSSFIQIPTRIIRNITRNPENSAAFSFVTDTDTKTCYLKICEKGAGIEAERLVQSKTSHGREAAESVSLFGSQVSLEREYLAHRVSVSDLLPGRAYICSLGSGEVWTKEFEIKTFNAGNDSFKALLLPDAQCGRSAHYQRRLRSLLQKGIKKAGEPAFIIELGDLVDSAADLIEYRDVLACCRDEFMSIAFAPTPGNHERDIHRRFANYVCHWNTPPCSLAEYQNLMYDFFATDFHFISLPVGDEVVAPAILKWFEEVLATSESKWKVVIMHSPPYGAKSLQSCARETLVPLMDKYDVDLCLSAHEHIYVRASAREGKKVEIGKGVLYLTLGTAGPKAYEGCANPWQDYVYGDKYSERYHEGHTDLTSAVATFSPSRIEVDVVKTSGRVVDRIVLEK